MKLADGTQIPEHSVAQGTQAFAAVTTSDTTVLSNVRSLWVGGAGNVSVHDQNDNVVTFNSVPAGTLLPISPKRVRATSTTATNIVALF